MSFVLSGRSRRELQGVHKHLALVVVEAIKVTKVDFQVYDGLRTLEEQREYVRTGVSSTMNSRHLVGCAVDLLPMIGDRPRWELAPLFKIADAMRQAGRDNNVPLRWGGCWDMSLTESVARDAEELHFGHVSRSVFLNRQPFIDGFHFELPRDQYPD